jgi:DNA-binding HxlR family transcriptional regulator
MGGTTRYNDLKRKIRGITNTMLASSLRELEEAGLVSRAQYTEMPVRVEYTLTGACEDLVPTLLNFAVWGKKIHKEE